MSRTHFRKAQLMSTADSSAPAPKFSYSRVLSVLIPIFILAIGVAAYSNRLEKDAVEELERVTVWRLLGEQGAIQTLSSDYNDSDGDLVADTPSENDQLLKPEKLTFSYIAQSDHDDAETTWKELFEAISQTTGRSVELVKYNSYQEQLDAVKAGRLHLSAFGTGEVELAVNQAGFVPLACFANKKGEYGYKMQFIVPSDSPIKKIEDLRGKRLTLTRPKSNSGCIAPMVLLANEFDMQLDRDYQWGMSQSHENSIRGIANGDYEVAAVASDILENMVASDNEITEEKFRIIYESKSYPPAVLGVPHNLDSKIVEEIRKAFFSFDWKESGLEKTFGADGSAQFAIVKYKEDWEPVRKIHKAAFDIANRVSPQSGQVAANGN